MADETVTSMETIYTARVRWGFALFMAIGTAAFVYGRGTNEPLKKTDFDQVWFAAQALWQNQSPYDLIGIGKAFEWKWPFYYPLPVVVLTSPLGLVSVFLARAIFAGLSVGALAWHITRDGWERVPLFASMSFLVSVQLVQWSPLMTAALLAPALSWVGIAKPNWGVAIMASSSSTRSWWPLILGGGTLVGAAFLLQPGWVGEWLAVVQSAGHFDIPVTLPFGFLMLAAAARWRQPEARLLLVLACVPQTPGFYDALMLFVIPRTLKESLTLVGCSYVVLMAMLFNEPFASDAAWMEHIARFTLWFMYLPCVVMVLRRPNVGTLPLSEGLDARLSRVLDALFGWTRRLSRRTSPE
jgi:hypothetical protein